MFSYGIVYVFLRLFECCPMGFCTFSQRKFFPILPFWGDNPQSSLTEPASLVQAFNTKHVKNGLSQLYDNRVDSEIIDKLAESITWTRSRFRGVDFRASQASGVDF